MIEDMHLAAIEKYARGSIAKERIIVPTVPEAVDDLRKLARATVALDLRRMSYTAEIVGLGRIVGCDQVPTGATATDQIERGEFPS